MRKSNLFKSILLIALFIAAISCSKDDDDSKEPDVARMAISEKVQAIQVPNAMKNSNNQYAQQASGYVTMIQGIVNTFTYFEPPEGAQQLKSTSTEGTYTWSYGGITIYMTYEETATKYLWSVDVDEGYGRMRYIEAEEFKTGASGWMKIYDYTGTVSGVMLLYEWVVNADDSVLLKMSDSEGGFKIEILGRPDNSGYARYYVENVLWYEFIWNSDGSGSYAFYDNGTPYESGTWTAADL